MKKKGSFSFRSFFFSDSDLIENEEKCLRIAIEHHEQPGRSQSSTREVVGITNVKGLHLVLHILAKATELEAGIVPHDLVVLSIEGKDHRAGLVPGDKHPRAEASLKGGQKAVHAPRAAFIQIGV